MAYSAQDRKRIISKYDKLVDQGETVVNAAKACGVPYLTISRWLKASGQVRRTSDKRQKKRAELLAKFDSLVAGGARVLNAAKECGVAYLTINRWKKAAGMPQSSMVRKRKNGTQKRSRPTKSPTPHTGPKLTTPEGFEVEFPNVDELIRVLKGLK